MHPLPLRHARLVLLALALVALAGPGGALAPAPLAAQDSRPTSKADKERERERARERERRRRDADDERDEDGSARLDTTVTVDPKAVVALSLTGGEVIVRAWDRPEVRVSATLEGGRIGFQASSARVSLNDEHGAGDAHFELTVPRGARLTVEGTNAELDVSGVHGGVEIDNANGDVRLADVGGVVRADLMTGELRVEGGDGDFRLDLASGDVVMDDVAGRIQVESVSGDITVRRARAREVRLETTSGSLTYDGTVQGDGQYELSTHSGDVRLRLPDGTRARLEADTYNGEFSSDFPVTMQPGAATSVKQRKYQLLVGDGNGPLIRVGSFSGDIHLARSAPVRPDSSRNDR